MCVRVACDVRGVRCARRAWRVYSALCIARCVLRVARCALRVVCVCVLRGACCLCGVACVWRSGVWCGVRGVWLGRVTWFGGVW